MLIDWLIVIITAVYENRSNIFLISKFIIFDHKTINVASIAIVCENSSNGKGSREN